LSASQTPLWQTRAPTATEQVDSSAGWLGRGSPFAIFAAQKPELPVAASQNSKGAAQSASLWHSVPHAPRATLQIGPSACPTQSVFAVQRPHVPAAPPDRTQ
jgi:hypothetical protein